MGKEKTLKITERKKQLVSVKFALIKHSHTFSVPVVAHLAVNV